MQATNIVYENQKSTDLAPSTEKITVDYHFGGTSQIPPCTYKLSIDSSYKNYLCHRGSPHITLEPTQCSNGHLSCYKCTIDRYTSTDSSKPESFCSQCNVSISTDSDKTLFFRKDACVERIINNIPITCPVEATFPKQNNARCDWSGDLRSLNDHLSEGCNIPPYIQTLNKRISSIEEQLKIVINDMAKMQNNFKELSSNTNTQRDSMFAQGLQLEELTQKVTSVTEDFANIDPYGEITWEIDEQHC